jgi:hypothetical protein
MRETHPVVTLVGMLFAAAALFFLPVSVFGLSMGLPLDCSRAELCFPQNYFDHDPSPGHADYACGTLSYDTHTGTDIRISYADMERGVPVLAVADGVVRAVRDGESEGEITLRGKGAVKGREAGNAVVLVHADGFETQYSHLKWGSVAVRPGQRVKTGQRLGLVGLSGATEFPHLEISVRRKSWPMDPFTGLAFDGCDGKREPLWSPEALASSTLTYQASGLLEAGFFTVPPTSTIAMSRRQDWIEGRADDPSVLVFSVLVFGPRKGDVWNLRLTGPDGQVLAESSTTQTRNQAQAMRYAGKKKVTGWQPGFYRGEFRLTRPGEGDVVAVAREIEVQ